MSSIQHLEVARLRNLTEVRLKPSDSINILFGVNGSGKTSLLEAVHLLGLGRSFRSSKLDPIIQDSAEDSIVFGKLSSGVDLGLLKSRRGGHTLKLRGEKQRNWAEAARHLPILVINSDTFSLLEGSPKVRRRFMDWGVFHVEHSFIGNWRRLSKCIAQRNLLLKHRSPDISQIKAWDRELIPLAELVDQARASFFEAFLPIFHEVLSSLIDLPDLSVRYYRGWPKDEALSDALSASLNRDIKYGATQVGPHRSDIVVRVGSLGAADVLSRGQQKLLVCALKISQGLLLERELAMKSVYLVDDLPSELDDKNRSKVCALLDRLDSQVFLSCVDPEDVEKYWSKNRLPRKFHVEHGKITQV
ncbi:MAG: DNA replication/repair protein RecF [Pseudohongiellaceae bacterium]|nr:DNA replication/repair protein RecF [Pseudohongiellaceae bacterium]